MGSKKYSIGVDFGTLSARAVLVEVDTGNIISTAVKNYKYAVLDEYLPDGVTKLELDWALQYPGDYIEAMGTVIKAVLKESKISPEDIAGLGTDFTECTMLPVDKDGTPLCMKDEYKSNPHSYVKLWKHHAAQEEANKLNRIAAERGEAFLARYGGKISSEWMIPKIWQILDEAPEIYYAADRFMEAADWITLQLTGEVKRNSCTAGYKSIWHKQEGYPLKEFFKALDPRLENVIDEKLGRKIYPLGTKAGEITGKTAELTGLKVGTAVAVGVGDAHCAVPGIGITEPGKMLMVMGTSGCDMLLSDREVMVPGICGVVEDGIVPGYFGYEAGQACMGDHFQWFVQNCVPAGYYKEAEEKNINIFTLIENKANSLRPGESGLLALDWWNGNRSVLVDADLSGVILGCSLATKPEEIYRALVEAIAYGKKMIIETFKQNGVSINELYAAGGIPDKSSLTMQIFADVMNMDIKMAASPHSCAIGSAMFGTVAAGKDRGGYDSIIDAAKAMGKIKDKIYRPIQANVEIYNEIYAEYAILHDYFGRGANDVMKRLRKIKYETSK
ncbi:MAG: ribulokinase [Clostridiaceae bacterium]